jgi:muramoyltetrapeptide carboxypeptidase LdcA involved in peptidoglycan recycling
MIPEKLRKGDEIRILAPARSMELGWVKPTVGLATRRLKELGFKVSFGRHVSERDFFDSSSVEHRVEDLHDAFRDKSVKAILTVIGGFNSIEVLPHLDYKLIKKNPKILCGFSDITALANGIYAKTGLVTYSGPHLFNFGEVKGFEHTLDHFKKCLLSDEPFEVTASDKWSNDRWATDQENRTFERNEGFYTLQPGKAEGTIIGANLVTFHALSGTPFMPSLKNSVLFIEDDHEENVHTFNRTLASLSLNPEFKGVKGIVIGRFQPQSEMGRKEIEAVVRKNPRLRGIPIIAGVDFGHTTPLITFPIGGKARITADKRGPRLEILAH